MNADLLAGNIAAHWLQAGALATAALVAVRLLNLNSPRSRLAALHLALIAIFLSPLIQPWRAEEPPVQMTPSVTAVSVTAGISEAPAERGLGATQWLNSTRGVVLIVIAGIVTRLLWLFYGVLRLARFSRLASTVASPAVAGVLEEALIVSPRYIQQTGGRGPWTFGFCRPTIALPAGFDALVSEFQRSVICHELIHVKRRDMAVAFCEELAVATLWFHPWIWLLRADIRVAREQVVDGRVVTMLGNRDEYVRCLVDIAGHDLAPHFSHAGAGMLRPRELRARVDAIFQEVHMSPMRFAVAAIAFVAVTISTGLVAAAGMPLRASSVVTAAPTRQTAPDAPRRQVNMVYPEFPQDALDRGIRGTVVVDITVNAAGDVTTAAVASGPQELRASAFKAALGLKYAPGRSTTAMKIAVEYLLTGTSWGVKIGEALTTSGGTWFSMTRSSGGSVTNGPATGPDASGAYRVGGEVRPPKKTKDVPPEYPAIAQQARVQGVVIIEARIDERGHVSDVRTLRSIPLLDQAAIDAVKQWEYEPPVRNGNAVPVLMTVTVNFTLRDVLRVRLTVPDGRTIDLSLRPGEDAGIKDPLLGWFHFKTRRVGADAFSLSVYGEDNETHLGSVTLVVGGPVMQSPTSPSFGIQLLSVE